MWTEDLIYLLKYVLISAKGNHLGKQNPVSSLWKF